MAFEKQVDKMIDILSDMLTRIRNGQKASLLEIFLYNPMPKICIQILKILQKEGFIRGFKNVIIQDKEYFVVLLKYNIEQGSIIRKIKRVSKSGRRFYIKSKHLWKVFNGKGIFIISTSRGLLTDSEARIYNLGGEVICYLE